jgi:hypothetical protein
MNGAATILKRRSSIRRRLVSRSRASSAGLEEGSFTASSLWVLAPTTPRSDAMTRRNRAVPTFSSSLIAVEKPSERPRTV